jgi:hypothetical protein
VWDRSRGQFVTCLTSDKDGNVWIGTEDSGVWRFSPKEAADRRWSHFDAKTGLGDNSCYSVICDKRGRLWAGTLNHGVSVYNGKAWKTYGPVDGPIGSHVVALTASPLDGDVWGATECGLFRYSLSKSTWRYYTRAEGLPSDQINSLACLPNGNLVCGTDCDGLTIGSAASDFTSWRVIPGRDSLPNTPSGAGLPSRLINAVLVARDGALYVGTTCGLAVSRDGGGSFIFTRGSDWKDKAAGLWPPIPTRDTPNRGDLLLEDWVTCLGEDLRGQLYVGHRRQDVELRNSDTGKRLPWKIGAVPADFAQALFTLPDGDLLVGQYGAGVVRSAGVPRVGMVPNELTTGFENASPLPVPAVPATAADLAVMAREVAKTRREIQPGTSAVFLGDDWDTQGDWVGRYGKHWATMCAARAPMDHIFPSGDGYAVPNGEIGPHHAPSDSVRLWVHWEHTDNPKSLYDPIPGYRRQSEWDDHGEAYGPDFDGPDVWVTCVVPAGVHRISLYFFNKDGQTGVNRFRDFPIELRPFVQDIQKAADAPILARARVHSFWGGVYKNFAVAGPAEYRIRIGRNGSHNTIVSGVMLDRLAGPKNLSDDYAMLWLGHVPYNPPDLDAISYPDPHALDRLLMKKQKWDEPMQANASERWDLTHSAGDLWNVSEVQPNLTFDEKNMWRLHIVAYRSAVAGNAKGDVLENYRWHLHQWTPTDRERFSAAMKKSRAALLEENPEMKRLNY